MSEPLVLAGQYGSPYTLKMRAVMRYRHIPFRWMLRDSKWDDLPPPPIPIIPVIAYPDGEGGYGDVTVTGDTNWSYFVGSCFMLAANVTQTVADGDRL